MKMGAGNSNQKVLEPYTSFDVLPTEYFNRQALQQQQQHQQQQQPATFVSAPVYQSPGQAPQYQLYSTQRVFYQPPLGAYSPQQQQPQQVVQPQAQIYTTNPSYMAMPATGYRSPYDYQMQAQAYNIRPMGYTAQPAITFNHPVINGRPAPLMATTAATAAAATAQQLAPARKPQQMVMGGGGAPLSHTTEIHSVPKFKNYSSPYLNQLDGGNIHRL